jgi:hypothetical protein
VVAHEVFAGQDGVLLQDRRIVGAVRISSPDVESTARFQNASHVPEPSREQLLERLVADEVVCERTVLGTQLLGGRLALRRVAGDVESLVMATLRCAFVVFGVERLVVSMKLE